MAKAVAGVVLRAVEERLSQNDIKSWISPDRLPDVLVMVEVDEEDLNRLAPS